MTDTILNNTPATEDTVATDVTTEAVVNTNTPVETPEVDNEYKRPEWLPEKFKTEIDLANSYKELESKIGGTFGAPEEYKWDGEDEPDGVKLFKRVAKEHNLSQKAFNEITASYLEKEKAIIEVQQKQVEEVRKELGEERINKVRNQLTGIGLTDEQMKTIGNFATGKVQFEALELMMKKINNSVNTVSQNAIPSINVDEKIREIYSKPDYRYNAGRYEAQLNELYKMKAV